MLSLCTTGYPGFFFSSSYTNDTQIVGNVKPIGTLLFTKEIHFSVLDVA